MNHIIEFFVDGNPQPQPKDRRRWQGVGNYLRDPDGFKAAWRENVIWTAKQKMQTCGYKMYGRRTPIIVGVFIYRIKTKTYRKMDEYPWGKPDAENYYCLIANALQGIIYEDDAQIVDVICRKRFASGLQNPGAMIQIKPVGKTRK